MAARGVGVVMEADRTVGARALGVRVGRADDETVGRAGTPVALLEVSEARGRGMDPTGPELDVAMEEVEARGVGSMPLVRPVNDALGFGMVRVAAVGVFIGEAAAGADAVLLRPGVAGPREGSAGIGCAWMIAAATRDSRRRAGPETGGRELVKVLLRRLRVGIFSSLAASEVSGWASDEEARGVYVGIAREERPAEALPDRDKTGSGLAAAIAEERGLSNFDPAVGVTRDGRGAKREIGFVTVDEPAEGRVTVDVAALAEAICLLGVFSATCLPSCAFLAASAAHFCIFALSRSKSSSSSSSSSSSLLPLLPALFFASGCTLSLSFFGRCEPEILNELLPNSNDASPLSSIRLPPIILELPIKLPVRLSSIVSSPTAFFTTRPTPKPLKPSALPLLGELGLISATPSSGTILHRGLAL